MCVPLDKFVKMLVLWYVKIIIMEKNASVMVCQIGKIFLGFGPYGT